MFVFRAGVSLVDVTKVNLLAQFIWISGVSFTRFRVEFLHITDSRSFSPSLVSQRN